MHFFKKKFFSVKVETQLAPVRLLCSVAALNHISYTCHI